METIFSSDRIEPFEIYLLITECLNLDKMEVSTWLSYQVSAKCQQENTQKKSGENSHKGRRRTNFRKTYFQKTKIHMTAKLQALGVLALIFFSENIRTVEPSRHATLRAEGLRGNTAQIMKTDSGKSYLTFYISAKF